jgi:hypothetical protein
MVMGLTKVKKRGVAGFLLMSPQPLIYLRYLIYLNDLHNNSIISISHI